MNRIRVPIVHPLKEVFFTAIESVTSALSASSGDLSGQSLPASI